MLLTIVSAKHFTARAFIEEIVTRTNNSEGNYGDREHNC